MDPNQTLKDMLDLARENRDVPETDLDTAWLVLEELSSLVLDLDEWIRKGGFLPSRWQRPEDRLAEDKYNHGETEE